MKKALKAMNYNERKYWVEGSELLTEAEMIQMAKDLRELERLGVIEFRDGRWGLVAGPQKTVLKMADMTEKKQQ
jgi:hypothetical protein